MNPRRSSRLAGAVRSAATVLALVAGVLAVAVAPAQASPADGTYLSCSGTAKAPTAPYYVMVGGAPLLITLDDVPLPGRTSGTPTRANVTYHADCGRLFPRPRVPRSGVFIRGYAHHHATGATYEIVAGAPITVHRWSHVRASGAGRVIPVDADVIPAATATRDATKVGATTLRGYLHARVPNGATFAGFDTATKRPSTYYRVDSARHPVPQAAPASGEPVVDQASIDACQRMTCDPLGEILTSAPGFGLLHLEGYAMDFPALTPARLRVVVDNRSAYTITADRPTAYLPTSVAGDHGFSWSLSAIAGTHQVCATILGSAPGATTAELGCSYVSVRGSTPGRVHRPEVKTRGHHKVKVRWQPADARGNPINTYLVRCTGAPVVQAPGSKHHHRVKHLAAGRHVRCKVRAINAGSEGGKGEWSKRSKPVRVR